MENVPAKPDPSASADNIYREALAGVFAANAIALTDMLSAATRAERDRLLATSLIGWLVIDAVTPPASGKAGWIDITLRHPALVIFAVIAILAYYAISFAVLAFADRSRWLSMRGGALLQISEWTQRITSLPTEAEKRRAELELQIAARQAKYADLNAEHENTISRLEAEHDKAERKYLAATPHGIFLTTPESGRLHKLKRDEYDRFRSIQAKLSNKAMVDEYVALSRTTNRKFEFISTAEKTLDRWKRISTAHFAISLAIPLGVATATLALLASRAIGLLG